MPYSITAPALLAFVSLALVLRGRLRAPDGSAAGTVGAMFVVAVGEFSVYVRKIFYTKFHRLLISDCLKGTLRGHLQALVPSFGKVSRTVTRQNLGLVLCVSLLERRPSY